MLIREIKKSELEELLNLYTHLHEKKLPEINENLIKTWNYILDDENYNIIVCEENGKIVSSCVCVIIPNLTRNVRPYALVENVVTHSSYRGKGYATNCLDFAENLARKANCYKIMLYTGSKKTEILNFYKKAGYSSTDKTAFIKRLKG